MADNPAGTGGRFSLPGRIAAANAVNILLIFVISRLVVYFLVYMGNLHYPAAVDRIHDPVFADMVSDTMNIMCQFDCRWFIDVARDGYAPVPTKLTTGHAANWAFLPGYPFAARLFTGLTGGDELLALMITANLFFLGSLFLWEHFLGMLGIRGVTRRISVLVMCFLPYSIYYMAPYTESMFLFFTLACFIFIHRRQYVLAGAAAMGMTVTRNVGVMAVFPILLSGIYAYGWRNLFRLNRENLHLLLGIMLTPLPMFLYQHYLYGLTGDSFAFMHIQYAWGRHFGNPLTHLSAGISAGGYKLYFSLVFLVSLPLVAYLFRKKMPAESLYFLICILIPIVTGVNAFPRYLFGLMPCLLALTLLMRRYRPLRELLPAVSAAFCVYFATAWGHSKFFTI